MTTKPNPVRFDHESPGRGRKMRIKRAGFWLIAGCWLITWLVRAAAADWPQWGGRSMRNMYSSEKGLPEIIGKVEFKPGTEDVDPKTVKNLKWAAKLGSQSY